jgi:hypothetical protein
MIALVKVFVEMQASAFKTIQHVHNHQFVCVLNVFMEHNVNLPQKVLAFHSTPF